MCLYSNLQVSAQEQSHAAELALWATAVAAADGVHSSKQVQEGVIGACSAIRRPWPALPALLEAALPEQPIERVMPCYCSCSSFAMHSRCLHRPTPPFECRRFLVHGDTCTQAERQMLGALPVLQAALKQSETPAAVLDSNAIYALGRSVGQGQCMQEHPWPIASVNNMNTKP